MIRCTIIWLLLAAAPCQAADPFALSKPRRIVFLGDSNTFAGTFIAYLDAFLITRFPDRKYELINIGLPSETVSGLSEPDHPYPRPDVHSRLNRALQLTKPDFVVVCYGMNDGIYHPFDPGRFEKYQEGIRRLLDKVRQSGVKVALMTPAPFDGLPVKDKLLAAGAGKYSWMRPYEKYDDVLGRYSEWLLTLRKQGVLVADPHTAINRHLAETRKTTAGYRVSGDGIHPNEVGHRIIAEELLRTLHAPEPIKLDTLSSEPRYREFWKLLKERERLLGLAWLTHVGHKRPDTPKGIPLAEAQKKAAALEQQIRELAAAAK